MERKKTFTLKHLVWLNILENVLHFGWEALNVVCSLYEYDTMQNVKVITIFSNR